MDALLDADGLARLREALTSARYTSQGIKDLLGEPATAALARNDFRAALRRTEEQPGRLATLVRLFVCGQTEPLPAVADALAPLSLAAAVPLLEADGDGVRAAIELEPYGDWWVVADLSAGMRPGRPLPGDHVLGIGGASTTLAAAALRHPVATALDLGTGCGVQALHLSTHAAKVTATDLLPRALHFAATTAALNGLDWELLHGDLTAPVAGRRFDLVVSNPPFVAGPGTTDHTYRDSGRPGDAVCAELVAAAPGLLADGGHMQFLANWLHVTGEPWEDRVADWLAGTGLDAWVIQREVSDPVAYVNLWLTDAAEDPARQPAIAAAWLDWFDAQKVDAVGFGLITLRAGGHEDPTVRIEDLRQTVDGAFGPLIGDWFARQDFLRGSDLLGARFLAAPGLTLRQEATLGADGWEVGRQVLSLPDGLRWSEEVDPVALTLVGACDGSVTLRDQVDVLAAAHGVPADVLADVAVPLVAHLVERGVLLPGLLMRALVQTVARASVTVEGEVVGSIGAGLLVLVGVTHTDDVKVAETLARKVYELRILPEEKSASDLGAPLLVVSQFTLYGDARKGRRPTWLAAARPEVAEPLIEDFCRYLRDRGAVVENGRFRTHMLVESVNVGPHTVMLEI